MSNIFSVNIYFKNLFFFFLPTKLQPNQISTTTHFWIATQQLRNADLNQFARMCVWTGSLLLLVESRERERPPSLSSSSPTPPPPTPPPLMLNRHPGRTRRAQYVQRLIWAFDVIQQETPAASACVSSFVAECCCFFKSGSFCQAAYVWIYGCIMFVIMTYGLPRAASICGRTRGGRCSPPSWTGCCEQHRVNKWATKGSKTVHVVEPVGPVVADGRSRQCVGWAEHHQWGDCQDSLTQLNCLWVRPLCFPVSFFFKF